MFNIALSSIQPVIEIIILLLIVFAHRYFENMHKRCNHILSNAHFLIFSEAYLEKVEEQVRKTGRIVKGMKLLLVLYFVYIFIKTVILVIGG